MARPSKLSEDLIEKLSNCVVMGMSKENACRFCLIHSSTLSNWIAEYQQGSDDPLLEKLVSSLSKSRAKFEESMVNSLLSSAQEKSDWRGFSYMLEKRERTQWGSRSEEQVVAKFIKKFTDWLEEKGENNGVIWFNEKVNDFVNTQQYIELIGE